MTRRNSTEYEGVGQSGYTAGRRRDRALDSEIQTREIGYPHGTDEDDVLREELITDERFIGRGGAVPDDEDPEKEHPVPAQASRR